jgi:hypothetical protein
MSARGAACPKPDGVLRFALRPSSFPRPPLRAKFSESLPRTPLDWQARALRAIYASRVDLREIEIACLQMRGEGARYPEALEAMPGR